VASNKLNNLRIRSGNLRTIWDPPGTQDAPTHSSFPWDHAPGLGG
jgi:hypothetical protein